LPIIIIDRLDFKTYFQESLSSYFLFRKTLLDHNVDCITPDGDKINCKGTLTGGYYEPRRSRLLMMATIRKIKVKLDELEERSTKIKSSASLIDRILADIQQLDQQRTRARDNKMDDSPRVTQVLTLRDVC